ncbi:hypothetical protein PG996_003312 [Apiospora saccharicola]|uniref:Uncharacterized protein n=1 Tax=Apiospora saccharicola TaxID=335842 RepID=A0ABR1W0Y2_9PEZI
MSLSTLEKILASLSPWVAGRRFVDLDTNKKFLDSMPFNGDYASALRNVLRSIHQSDVIPYERTILELGDGEHWPEQVTQAMIDFLQSYTPVTDEELRLACWRYLDKDSFEILQRDTFKNLREKQPGISDSLARIYGKPKFNKRAALNNINLVVANANWQERESLYLNMTYDADLQYLSSDINLLVTRCNSYVAKEFLSEYGEDWSDAGTEQENIATCLRGAEYNQIGTMMDPEYTAELSRLIQITDVWEVQPLYESVERICARLAELPRHITRNYRTALKHGEGLQRFEPNDLRDEICEKSTTTNNGNAVFDVIYDVESACKKYDHPRYESRPHMLPESLLDTSTTILIGIHNALIDYLEGQGCPREGALFAT